MNCKLPFVPDSPCLKGEVPLQVSPSDPTGYKEAGQQHSMATTKGANRLEKSKSLLKLTACELILDTENNTQEADDFPATDDHHQGNGVSC